MLHLLALLVAYLLVKRFYRPPRMNVLCCGIAGFSGPRAVDETKLRWLLSENLSRGKDSTGVYGNHLYKDVIESRDFILQPPFRAAIKGCKTVGAHTRAGTVGAKTKENAHPFRYGTDDEWAVVGAHNGFIIPEVVDRYTEDFGFPKNHFNVDSQIIFAALHKTGDVNILSKLDGAMAVWFIFPNKCKDTIYLYRRAASRDLNIGQAPEGLYFSSEAGPLRLIGCDRVYTLAGDVLYTLHKGEIIDRYQMTLPLVKSLAAGVSRSSWRSGVPIAEITALLPNAISQQHQHVRSRSGGTAANKQELFDDYHEHNNIRSMTSSKYADDTNLADAIKAATGSDKKDLEAFYMYIRSIREEINNLNAPIMDHLLTHSYSYPDFAGCVLNIKLTNMDDGKPLEGWSIIQTDDVDLCGITTPNGCSLVKVPPIMVKPNTPIQFLVYDPIDQVGPFTMTITPSRSRVMEVTLSIPFRQNEEKKGPKVQDNVVDTTKGNVDGSNQLPVHISGPVQQEVRLLQAAGADPELLQVESSKLHCRQKERISDGDTGKSEIPADFIPKAILTKVDPSRSVVNITNRVNKRKQLEYLTKTTPENVYTGWTPLETTKRFMYSDPDIYKWKSLYETKSVGDDTFIISITKLVMDASRVRGWDAYHGGTYYPLPVYMKMLLEEQPSRYLACKDYILAKDGMPHIVAERYNPFVLANDDGLDLRKVSFKYFNAFLNWVKDHKHIMKLTKSKLQNLATEAAQVASVLEHIVGEISDGLETNSSGGARPCDSTLRLAAIKARNFLRSELTDTRDFSKQIDSQIKAIDHSFEETAQKQLGSPSCID
jgi:hypothetical protein